MEELKDIKDIVEVHEQSFMLLIGLILITLLLISWAVYAFKYRRKKRKKQTPKEIALERLKKLDYNNTKDVVYTFEEQSEYFINEKNRDKFDAIKKELGVYKYKREIPPLDSKIASKIKSFIKELK
jgi:hypothetical protein